MPHLLVLGSFVMACCWKVERLPQAGETFTASALSIEPGGKGLNVAIAARRLGMSVDVVLGIGQDEAGQQLLRLLAQEGVGHDHVHALAAQSGYGAGMIGSHGQNAIAVYPGPNLLLLAAHAERAQASIERAACVYGQFETSDAVITRAFDIARAHGVPTVLNPSPWRDITPALLHSVDTFIVNEVEVLGLLHLMQPLAGLSLDAVQKQLTPALPAFWSSTAARLLVVTLGAQGSMAFRRDAAPVCAAPFAVQAIDTVGCGDAFAAGLCDALCRQQPLNEALRAGNACGALMAAHWGVLQALPQRAQMQQLLDAS